MNEIQFVEYGQNKPEVIMLLHGGGLSWWSLRAEAELLQKDYHVVLPILDGHAKNAAPFTGIKQNAEELISLIDARFGGSVLAIGGVSLGAQILVEMLALRAGICRFALIESALVLPMPLVAALLPSSLAMSYPLIQKESFAKAQFRSLRMPPAMFDEYFRDTKQISKADMLAFLSANAEFKIPAELSETSARALILAGSRESGKMRRSAALLGEAIKASEVKILSGYHHGELSLSNPQQYVELLSQLLAK